MNLTATGFFGERASTCYSVAKIYGELRRDLQLLREKLHIGFDVVQVSRLQTQRITLEPYLRVSGNPVTGRDWARVDFYVCCDSSYFYTPRAHVHTVVS